MDVITIAQETVIRWRVPEQSQAKNSLFFRQHSSCTDQCRFFLNLIKPDSTIAVPDIQSSA
jgi:hypothetical protein